MSTGNFMTMSDFDLIVFDTSYQGTMEEARQEYADNNDITLEAAGLVPDADISQWAEEGSEIYWESEYNDIDKLCKDKNYGLKFYEVKCQSGYYAGLQFLVEERDYCPTADYIFGAALRSMQQKERRLLNAWMNQIGYEHGGQRASVAYRFSNGETGYTLEPCKNMEEAVS